MLKRAELWGFGPCTPGVSECKQRYIPGAPWLVLGPVLSSQVGGLCPWRTPQAHKSSKAGKLLVGFWGTHAQVLPPKALCNGCCGFCPDPDLGLTYPSPRCYLPTASHPGNCPQQRRTASLKLSPLSEVGLWLMSG